KIFKCVAWARSVVRSLDGVKRNPGSWLTPIPGFRWRSIQATSDSHAAPVLAADFEQRIGYLPERAYPHRVHQHFEHVAVVDHRLLQLLQHGRRLLRMPSLEFRQPR